MNLVLSILGSIFSIVALLLILAAFTKKGYSVEREISINQPKQQVFDYLKFLKNQDNFSKWATMDANMKKSYQGTDGTVGFISAWDSENKNVGKGEQEITKIDEGKRIDYQIRFIKPFAGVANAYMTIESRSKQETLVNWGFDSKMKYPMNLMLLFMSMDKMIGRDFDTGLKKLKSILEN